MPHDPSRGLDITNVPNPDTPRYLASCSRETRSKGWVCLQAAVTPGHSVRSAPMLRKTLFSTPVAVVLLALTVLTLPGVPGAVSGWGSVLGFVDDSTARWALPAIGWVGLAVLFAVVGLILPRKEKAKAGKADAEQQTEVSRELGREIDALTALLRKRSHQAPGSEAEDKRRAVQAAGRNAGREVHGSMEWQKGTVLGYYDSVRNPLAETVGRAMDLGFASLSQQQRTYEAETVPGLWNLVDELAIVKPRMDGRGAQAPRDRP
jgi:hypothetical protein